MLIVKLIRGIRRRGKISQKRLSKKLGVNLRSVKHFAQSGEISRISLTKIAITLGIQDELEGLFEEVSFLFEEVLVGED